jgi:hypothetical protein
MNTARIKLQDAVRDCIAAGVEPDAVQNYVQAALKEYATDWVEWGDGHWRLDTCCPVCGDWAAGLCGHSGNPVLRREYEAKRLIERALREAE